MTRTGRTKGTLAQIALAAVALPFFVAVVWWTRDTPDTERGLILMGIVIATTVIGVFIDARAQRHLDEMEIAAAGFAARWSTVAVGLLAAFALFFIPFHSVLNELYASIRPDADGPPQMFVMGVVAALVVRALAAMLLRAGWMHAKR